MKPVTRILLIVIISFVFCQLMFEIFNYGAKKYSRHKYDRLKEILHNDSYHDILFIGSSIVHSNIHPRIIDSICTISSYNAGIEGGNLLEIKMIFDAYLVNHPPPDLLMLTLDLGSFNLDRKFFNHIDYYPYLSNNVVDRILCNNGHQTALLKIFPFMELTEYDEEMRSRCIKGLLGKKEVMPGQIEYKGFLTSSIRFLGDIPEKGNYLVEKKVSEGCLKLFQGIMDTCKTRNVRLILNFPPLYKKEEHNNILYNGKAYKMIRSLASDNNIHFIDDSKLSFCADSGYFSDFTHLNSSGAELYSAMLAKELLDIIRSPSLSDSGSLQQLK